MAAAVATLLLVGGAAWLFGGGATTEPADRPKPTLPLEFPVSELPPFQLEVRYQLDPGAATGPDGVPEDLEALITVSYGGPDLLRVEVNRSVPVFYPASGGPGPPHETAGNFVVLNHGEEAEYSADDDTFNLNTWDASFATEIMSRVEPLMWETWEDICTFGEHEFLEASPVAGRETVRVQCTRGTYSYELWVDAATGLMLRIAGEGIPWDLSGITATEYEVLSVAYEPRFAPETFSPSAPPGATVVDNRGGVQSGFRPLLPEGTAVPELTGRFVTGGEFTLSDLEGTRVALLFWGSWCGICLDPLDQLAVVANERPDVTFVAVLIADRPENALAVLTEHQIDLPVVAPDGPSGTVYLEQWVYGVPELVLVEANGTVAATHYSFGPLDVIQGILEDAGW